jgi:hypothetical protein
MVVIQINGNTVNDPINWQEFGIRIFRDDTINGLFIEYTTELQWNGLGYEIIRQAYNTDILKCGLLTVTVDYYCGNTPKRLLTGNIVIAECKFDLQRCIVTTKLFDNNYSTRINNNKSIELDAYITESKNGVTLPTYTDINIQTYIAATGSYYPLSRGAKGKYLTDYLRHMVKFMSDNEVTYSSPILQLSGLAVTSGLSLRTGKKTPIVTSFQKLFEAINKKLNLSITTQGNQLIIDSSTAIYSNQQAIQLDNIRDLIQFVEKERLFSAVEVGNDKAFQEWECNNGAGCANPQVKGFTFQKDQFGFVGTCNQDIVQDLVSKDIIIDSNIIEDVVVYGNQSFDDNVFIIDTIQNPTTLLITERRATQSNLLGVGTFYYYNGIFSNDKVIINHASDLPNQIANYITNPTNADILAAEFVAERTLAQTDLVIDKADFETRYSDTFPNYLPFNILVSGTQYSTSNNRFTASFAGLYSFTFRIFTAFQFSEGNGANLVVKIIANRRTSTGDLIENKVVALVPPFIYPEFLPATFSNSFQIFLNVGDTVALDSWITKPSQPIGNPATVTARFIPISPDYTRPAFFECTAFEPIIVQVPTINADLFRRINYEFQRPLNFEQVTALIDSPERIVRISQQQIGSVDAFIQEILINNLDKFETSFKLISNE